MAEGSDTYGGSPGGFEIDVAGATEALEAAGGLDGAIGAETEQAFGPAQTPHTPEGTTPEASDATDSGEVVTFERDAYGRFAPKNQPVESADTDTSFMGETFDPNSLPPELLPAYKQMQGHFTRATQEAAPWRRMSETLGVSDPTAVAQVLEHYNQLMDPQNWQALYEELGNNLGYQDPGISRDPYVDPQTPNVPTDLSVLDEYPELAPLKATLESQAQASQALEQRLEQLEGTWEDQRAQAEEEQFQMAIMGEVQRQTQAIMNANPTYGDEDRDVILAHSSFYDGNVFEAQKAIEDYVARRIAKYASQKQGINPGVTPIPGAATTSQQPAEYESFDDAHDAAMEYLRQVEAAG